METLVKSDKCVTCHHLIFRTAASENKGVKSCSDCQNYYATIVELLETQDDKMFKALTADCSICEGPMLYNKIFMCIKGHLVCESCNKKDCCSSCTEKMKQERNIVAEEIMRLSIDYILSAPSLVHCVYQKSGCDVKGIIEDIETHEQTCTFLTTVCFYCGRHVIYKRLYEHWVSKHISQITYNGSVVFTQHFKPYIHAFNESFIVNYFCNQTTYMFTVTHITLKQELKENVKYYYVLEFSNGKTGKTMQLKGQCLTFEVNVRKKNVKIESINTSTMSVQDFECFVSDNKYFTYTPLILIKQ